MTRPKKTPAPKQGRGRPPVARAADPRLRIPPELYARLVALPGGSPQEHALRALAGYLDGPERRDELHAYREGRASTLREVTAAVARLASAIEPVEASTSRAKVERSAKISGTSIDHIVIDDPAPKRQR